MVEYASTFHGDYFTFDGVLNKIHEFIKQPWSASISCDELPKTGR